MRVGKKSKPLEDPTAVSAVAAKGPTALPLALRKVGKKRAPVVTQLNEGIFSLKFTLFLF